jgi:putative ABC transport system ATP-binding protein
MIQVNNLKKVFEYSDVYTVALGGINLEVDQGEFVAIMGPSGCGKTTLLNILGLLDSPTEGSYLLNGTETANLNQDQRTALRKGNIGFVFQSFNLIDELTVEQNVELPLKYMNVPPAERRAKTAEMLQRLGMSHRAKHFPYQLSTCDTD